MTTRLPTELPFHFGATKELFGLFHAAEPGQPKSVLLCPPLGQDQIRCHRLYRQLAHALVAAGIPVLRFDYYGTGDSAGVSEEVDWERCLADTAAAADELRRRSGNDQVVAFGARLGGNIALASVTARFAGLVLWDPILDGHAHVARLDAMQAALAVDTKRFSKPRHASEAAEQWLGFAIGEHLRQQIIKLRPGLPGAPTLVLDSRASATPASCKHKLISGNVVVRPLEASVGWDDLARLELAILSHPLVQSVTNHLLEDA